jgi:hypothetical protein
MSISDEEFRSRVAPRQQTFDRCIKPFTVMVVIANGSDPTPSGVIQNGTGCLINTGKYQFLVTNDHV